RKILRSAERLKRCSDDGFVLSEAPRAGHTAGEKSAARLDKLHSAFPEDFQIVLGCGMLPHVHVHRWRYNDGCGSGQIESGQKIIRDALRELGYQVGCGRSDKQRIDGLCNSDVFNS